MNQHILTILNQLLAYSDSEGVTNNPKQRAFDHSRRIYNIPISQPFSEFRTIAPGSSSVLFDGTKNIGLIAAMSVLQMKLVSAEDSMYAIQVTSGPSNFRTKRSVDGIASCTVTVNNNALAVFDFTGAGTSSIQVGDIMRISGANLYDEGPFSFSDINSGLWVVIGRSGTKISATRQTGEMFSGSAESVPSIADGEVEFYANNGVQKGDKFFISALFSQVSRRSYEVFDAKPNQILFVPLSHFLKR